MVFISFLDQIFLFGTGVEDSVVALRDTLKKGGQTCHRLLPTERRSSSTVEAESENLDSSLTACLLPPLTTSTKTSNK